MSDVFTRKKRSQIMSRIRSTNTEPERVFERFLQESGTPYKYQPALYGKPDFLLNEKIAVFIDSAFWHGRGNRPKQNKEYWMKKLERNRRRDKEVNKHLTEDGFKVVRLDSSVVLRTLRV